MRQTSVLVSLPLLACRAPAGGTGPLPDLAPAFGERVHGFTPLAPALRGDGDELSDAAYDADERLAIRPGGSYSSQLFRWSPPFDELLLSWNATVPDGVGLLVEVAVESTARGERSPWLVLGGWGLAPRTDEVATAFDGGRVDVDVLRCDRTFDAFRVRLRAIGTGDGPLVVHAAAACLTDRGRLATLAAGPCPPGPPVEVLVPALTQRSLGPELAPRVCSPTSVAMVLASYGVEVPLEVLAAEVYDAEHDVYGNWPRAVQAAFTRGVPGALVRLSSWRAVETFLAGGVPLIISVRAEPGELRGAPYERTSGHLLVVTGLAPGGRVLVNDPAAPSPEEVPRSYHAEDLERCWMRRGGVAYALGPPLPR